MAFEFGDMSRRGQWGVVGVVCLAFVVVFYMYLWSPRSERITSMRNEIANVQLEIQRTRQVAEQLPELETEIAELEGQLAILKNILPEEQESDFLLRRVQSAASDTNLDLRRATFQDPILHDFYAEAPMELDVTGTYHNLARFFDLISKFARIITVGQVSITALQDNTVPGSIQATFTASTFYFLPEEEIPVADPTTGG